MKLQDKVAIVTGADSGIGQATAASFAREGADVCITQASPCSWPPTMPTT